MAKEFLQKHFINDVKAILGHGSNGAGNANTNVKLQDIVITKNGIYKPDEGFDAFGEVTIDIGGASAEPAIAAGLYETGTNYGTMIASWDELVESGKIVITDGVISRGNVLPDKLPDINEYGFYYDVVYNCVAIGVGVAFHADGSLDLYQGGSCVGSPPAGSATYSANTVDVSSVGFGVGSFSDAYSFTCNVGVFCIGELAQFNGDLVFPCDGSITAIPDYFCANGADLTGIEITSGITSIGESAFSGCSNLESVDLSKCTQLTSIGQTTFCVCESLTSVKLPPNLASIDGHLFQGCTSLISIEIPDSVLIIDEYAFDRCENLVNVTFGENSQLKTIEEHAFSNCNSLTSIAIPDSTTTIQPYAFGSCTSMTSVTFGENSQLESIGENAFNGCGLTEIEIPYSVTTIDYMAISYCENLTKMVVLAETPPSLGEFAFEENTALTEIKVPASSVDAYKAADGWSEYAGIIVPIT